jgi:hypothetical protein
MGQASNLVSCAAAAAFLALCLTALIGLVMPDRKAKGGPRCDD